MCGVCALWLLKTIKNIPTPKIYIPIHKHCTMQCLLLLLYSYWSSEALSLTLTMHQSHFILFTLCILHLIIRLLFPTSSFYIVAVYCWFYLNIYKHTKNVNAKMKQTFFVRYAKKNYKRKFINFLGGIS